MKTKSLFGNVRHLFQGSSLLVGLCLVASTAGVSAHDLAGSDGHAHGAEPASGTTKSTPPAQAQSFDAFAPKVKLRWDENFLYVESNGIPAHNMMVGITAWQQQVPMPQSYFGENAWRIPLAPVPAEKPQTIKGHFLRGAIAIAANGIPIFNPQNNRGEISEMIGELDEWGGHCGRADDYHYHVAPLHLQTTLGSGKPVAYALDGYPVYGLTEPDGSATGPLDECHGHTTPQLGYHYHAAKEYPYVLGGFHGVVTEREGQVDPQPRATPVRPSLPGLRGAEITDFKSSPDGKSYKLRYEVDGKNSDINYSTKGDGIWDFEFISADGTKREETYQPGKGGDRKPRAGGPPPKPEPVAKPGGSFMLRSPVVENGAELPVEFSGDGSGASIPLTWTGAPAGTKSYALIMHHIDPEGVAKWYWTLYDIPADVTSLPKDVQGVGKVGTGFKGGIGYEPPHSKGPGAKKYTLTLYALSAAPEISVPPSQVNRKVLLAAIKDTVLASAELNVVHTSAEREAGQDDKPRPKRDEREKPPARPGQGGLIKPGIDDTEKVNVYADNWFMLYINGKLTAVDSIDFIPHNVISVDILPEYPMSIAVMAKDNADPKTGMEYGTNIGDAGFIIKFADGTVSNATWKAKSFFKGPLKHDTANPKVEHTPIPADWFAVDFDDSQWAHATEYSEQRVNPKESFYKADFTGAKFIWTEDLDLDNTVIFRTKIDKPGWKPRWNTKPDLDVTTAPAE